MAVELEPLARGGSQIWLGVGLCAGALGPCAQAAGAIAEMYQDAVRPAAHVEILWVGKRYALFRHDPLETLDLRLDSTCTLEVEILRSGVAAADELRT